MVHDEPPLYRKRWMIIYKAMVDPRQAKDIAKHTGVSVSTVHKLIANYKSARTISG
jgi:transposase